MSSSANDQPKNKQTRSASREQLRGRLHSRKHRRPDLSKGWVMKAAQARFMRGAVLPELGGLEALGLLPAGEGSAR